MTFWCSILSKYSKVFKFSEKWIKKLCLTDQGGHVVALENLFKPSENDVERAAQVFRCN